MSQPKSAWQRTRHTQQVQRRERKQRAMKKNYKPRTRHERPTRRSNKQPLRSTRHGSDVQPVRTRQRQKVT